MPLSTAWDALPHVGAAGRDEPCPLTCAHPKVGGPVWSSQPAPRTIGHSAGAEVRRPQFRPLPSASLTTPRSGPSLGVDLGQRSFTITHASCNLSGASIGGSYPWTIFHRTVPNLIPSNAFGSWRVDSVLTTRTFPSFKISSMRSRVRWPLGKNRTLHCLVYAALLKTLCLI